MSHEIEISGVTVHVAGDGPETIVMVHGWPDTHRVWSKQVAYFSAQYRCVSFTLPGFDSPKKSAGYSLEDVTNTIRQIVDSVSPDNKVILMLHDWGCIFGYQFAMLYPERVSRMIAIDIGDSNSPAFAQELTLKAKAMILAYQGTLACAWFIGGPLGGFLTRGMSKALKAKAEPQHVHAGMNYPYAIRWMRALGSFDSQRQIEPACPFFYAYASRKPFMFQSQSWLEGLRRNPANMVQEFDCGHWVMIDRAEAFNAAVSQWLQQ